MRFILIIKYESERNVAVIQKRLLGNSKNLRMQKSYKTRLKTYQSNI